MTWQGDLYQFCSTKVHTSGNLSFCFKKQIDYWSNDMQYLSLPPQGFDSIFNFFFERICPTMCIWLHWDGLFSWIRKECYNISRKQQNFSDTMARPKSKSSKSRLNVQIFQNKISIMRITKITIWVVFTWCCQSCRKFRLDCALIVRCACNAGVSIAQNDVSIKVSYWRKAHMKNDNYFVLIDW